MQRYDALIVGGGPAGAACAWALRRAGMAVAVLDQAIFPRDKVCAGWITPGVLSDLQIDPADYASERGLQPISRFRIALMGKIVNGKAANIVHYPDTVSYGIRRVEFDDYLLRRSGARLFLGEPVHSVQRSAGEWQVNNQLRAPMLVGAGGHACPVARALGAHPAGETAVVAKQIEFLMPESARAKCRVRRDQPELYFSRDLAGYGWCFRKGDYLNIGLGREDRWDLSKHVERFVEFLMLARGIPRPPGHLHGHAYLLYGRSKRELLANGALLVGDAAGLAYPHSGEGIRPAIESGLFAAQTILAAKGDYRRENLASYLDSLSARFQPAASLSASVYAAMPVWLRAPLARGLFSSPTLLRRVVLDQGFLHANQPAMAAAQSAA